MSILPFDELNAFKIRLSSHFVNGRIRSRKDCEDIIDEMLDLYLLFYASGVDSVNSQFGTDIQPSAGEIQKTIYQKIDGATWEDRVWTWYETGGTEADIARIAETEAHRNGNAAAFDTAVKAGAKEKTWVCMMLPTSRDTHIYLNGTTVGINDEFYTFAGNHAMYPGQFGVAEEDVNCLCQISFK
jgi:hypothetical protein